MRSAFYTLAGPVGRDLAGSEGPCAFAVRLAAQEVAGRDPEAVVLRLERLVRRAGELPSEVVRELPQDRLTELRAAADEWLAVLNPSALHAGWVYVARADSAVVRLGPGRVVLSGQAGSPLVHVPPSRAELLPSAPVPQWGSATPGSSGSAERKPHV